MGRLVLVDAYNALYRLFRRLPEDRDLSRAWLVERVRQRLLLGDAGGIDRVHLVFDTWPGAERAGLRGRQGRVSWQYATGSADDLILEEVRRHEGRRKLVVVTDDRELRAKARQLGALGRTLAEFFDSPRPPAPRPRPRPTGDGPPLRASDFGLPEGEIDLDDPGDDLR